MKKDKFCRSRSVWLILILIGVTFFSANSSQALLLTNTSVGVAGPVQTFNVNGTNASWYTQYVLYADQFNPSPLDAFCVENVSVASGQTYELVPVPGYLSVAARIADQFFNGSGWSKTATQIAVWEAAFDTGLNINDGYFQYLTGTYTGEVQTILANMGRYGITGPISLAHSPAGSLVGTTGASQDYLVPAAVPEPSTMLLLGTGIIGLFGVSRKKFSKKL